MVLPELLLIGGGRCQILKSLWLLFMLGLPLKKFQCNIVHPTKLSSQKTPINEGKKCSLILTYRNRSLVSLCLTEQSLIGSFSPVFS